ncbi:hypothetical protein [Aneurinibacillus aneurinilyticus]|jgi:hypothetical protein|uniref:hypothetical protein n=1 Tax=Aneurinibacillus aneurinilyticus TaxID=1391 RepID=UPI0023F19009|nr:hypothetical protein [Aneurinibacillus aneurinilyticus]
MSRYVIYSAECQQDKELQVVTITSPHERWEDIVDALQEGEKVYPVGFILANPGPRWNPPGSERKRR